MKLFFYYLALINLLGFFMMGIDKGKAKKQKWRIPERTLFAIALLAGSLGVLAGMYCFRHKTKHARFIIGIPFILVFQLAMTYWLFNP